MGHFSDIKFVSFAPLAKREFPKAETAQTFALHNQKGMVIIMKNIGNKLRELRGNRSIEFVANEIGVSKSSIAMYETGKRIPRDSIKKKLSEYYNCSITELFFAD